MMTDWAVPLGSLVISIATFIVMALTTRRKANESSVQNLEARVRQLEADLATCQRERSALLQENIELMRRVVAAER